MMLSLIIPTLVLVGAVTGCVTSKPQAMGNMGKNLDMASPGAGSRSPFPAVEFILPSIIMMRAEKV